MKARFLIRLGNACFLLAAIEVMLIILHYNGVLPSEWFGAIGAPFMAGIAVGKCAMGWMCWSFAGTIKQ